MLERLRIKDLGIIDETEVEFGPGLTVLTGETGAGKTMVVTALGLLLGARAETSAVRTSADQAVVEGEFSLGPGQAAVAERIAEAGGDLDDGNLLVARTLAARGRSRTVAGGRTVPVSVLSDIGAALVSVHGQSEQLTLSSAAAQRALLDAFGGPELASAAQDYQDAFRRWKDAAARAEHLQASADERAGRLQRLRAGLEEIAEVRPVAGEDVTLRQLSERLGAIEELRAAAAHAAGALAGDDFSEAPSAQGLVEEAAHGLEAFEEREPVLAEVATALRDIGLQLSDASGRLSGYLVDLNEVGTGDVEEVEQRRAALASLSAYGDDVDAVLAWETSAAAELLSTENEDASLGDLLEEVETLSALVRERAAALGEHRRRAAGDLERQVGAELDALAMPGARILVAFDALEEPGAHGMENVRLQLLAHEGGRPGELGKTASGGELSRIMLALEVVLGESDPVPTFVFDEVDAGVGGKAAVEIGRRLARLARGAQVLVVTHLPQVAAWADAHVTVRKSSGRSGIVSGVGTLDPEERVLELARMLAGKEESDSARAHARELIDNAADEKSSWPETQAERDMK